MATPQPAVQSAATGQATVEDVLDGDTLRLADGRVVRLAGISAPALAEGGGGRASPAAKAARKALIALSQPGPIRLEILAAPDRHGRTPAEGFDATGRWLQGEMVSRGLARFQNDDGSSRRGAELLALEKAARAKALGIWGRPASRVRRVTETPHFVDSFQVVEGTVRGVSSNQQGVFLDFGDAASIDAASGDAASGDEWRSDFSVFISRPRLAALKRSGIEPQDLAARAVRVRGWIILRNGPMIELSHPDHLERIE